MKTYLKFLLSLLIIIISLSNTYAQGDTTSFKTSDETKSIGAFSLEQCIKYALENSEALKKAGYQKQISQAEVGERLSAGLPQVDLRAGVTDNIGLQKNIIEPGNSFYEAFTSTIPPADRPPLIAFAGGLKYSSNFAFNLEQLLFDFSYFIGLKGARTYVELSQKQIKQSEIDVISNVSKAYYAVLINKERLALLDANYERLDTVFKNTSAMFKNGMAEKVDVMRTQVSLNNIQTEKQKLLQLQELTLKLLKFQMGMPVRDSLILEGNLREMNLDANAYLNESVNYQDRIEYSILQTNKQLQEINLQYNKSLYLPRLTLVGTYGALTSSNKFNNMLKFNKWWFTYGSVGLNFSMPIIDGFKKRYTVNKLRLEVLKVQEDEKIFKRTVDLQTEQAKSNILTYSKDLEIQKQNMELAQEVARVAKVKYENGVGSTLEIVNAESSFKEAENNYFNALYNVVISKVDLDKALGKLGK